MAVDVAQGGDANPERWQRNIKTLKQGIAHIYETKEFADVQFVVGPRTFKAHRLILAARSPEFLKILLKKNSDNPQTWKEVVEDVTEDGFEILLRYIYTDEVGEMDRDKLLEAYRAADRFNQSGLLKVCEDRIAEWEINCDNLFSLLNQLADIPSMKQRCLQFLRNNALSVLTADNLTEASAGTFWLMFESGSFKHAPALTRLKNAVRWASEQLPEQEDYRMARELLLSDHQILGKCGIQTLNSSELASLIAQYKNLLTPDECTAFFVNAHNPESMPLPTWCTNDE